MKGESLGLPPGQGTLPSLKTGGGGMGWVGEREGNGRRGESGNFCTENKQQKTIKKRNNAG